MARPRYSIRPRALRFWETSTDIGRMLSEVVDAVEALPAWETRVVRIFRPPAVIHEVTAEVFGRRFMVRGVRGADGKWIEVWLVLPLPPERRR